MLNYLINLKVSTKALLATFIPFLINIIWLGAMWCNTLQLQQLSAMEKQQANFLESVNEFTQLFYKVQGAFIIATVFYTPRQIEFYNELNDRLIEKSELLNKNPAILDNQRASLNGLTHLAANQKNILKSTDAKYNEDKWHMFTKLRKAFLVDLDARLDDKRDIKELLLPQRLALDQLRSNQLQSQQIFQALLISGIAANLLIAGFLHFVYSRYISRRINTLVANARALSSKRSMLEPLPGRDDFSIIDAAMHESERDITAAFEQKQEIMRMIAHDLKSPLTASQLSFESMLLRDKDFLVEDTLKSINRVTGNNMRLLALINDLLTIDALELGHLELSLRPEQIKQCINEAVEILSASSAAKNIDIVVKAGNDTCLFDYRRILQVLVNLISNAIKFSPSSSQISIVCEKALGKRVKVLVSNTGKEIPKEDQAMIFQKYFQTEQGKSAKGTGLGLAISKLIVNSHAERIGFESHPGEGTTFWFTLAEAGPK